MKKFSDQATQHDLIDLTAALLATNRALAVVRDTMPNEVRLEMLKHSEVVTNRIGSILKRMEGSET